MDFKGKLLHLLNEELKSEGLPTIKGLPFGTKEKLSPEQQDCIVSAIEESYKVIFDIVISGMSKQARDSYYRMRQRRNSR